MIERVLIAPNPVTAWESFPPMELPFGEGRGLGFVKCDYENRRMGGYWQASVSVVGNSIALAQFFQDGLGRDVKLMGTRGFTGFHGYVNGIRWHLPGGGAKYKSLDLMANRIFCRYKDASSSDAFARSAQANDTDSQARFGIKEFPVSGGRSPSASVAAGVATRLLPMKAWPKYAREGIRGGGGGSQKESIDLLLRGYIQTLRWRVFNQTSGGTADTQSADLELATILASAPFLAASSTWRLQANPMGALKYYDADQWMLDIVLGIVAQGDNIQQPWTFYLTEDRIPVFEPWTPGRDVAL
jgi:hypothetical protein